MGERIAWKDVVKRAAEIVESYDTPVTLRQLWYRLVAEGTLPNIQHRYTQLSGHTSDARRAGWFPPLVDRGRRIVRPPSWEGVDSALAALADQYRRDRTAGQPVAVYIGIEKDALAAQVESWVDPYGIPVLTLRGWSSEGYERTIIDDLDGGGRPSILLYFGDLDPAGEGIEANLQRRVGFGEVHRLALTLEQVQALDLPENVGVEAKLRNSPGRFAFLERYGRLFQVEVDAVPPDVLRGLVLGAVDEYLDRSIYEDVLAQEKTDRELLTAAHEGA
jgi:hypothetical protein